MSLFKKKKQEEVVEETTNEIEVNEEEVVNEEEIVDEEIQDNFNEDLEGLMDEGAFLIEDFSDIEAEEDERGDE